MSVFEREKLLLNDLQFQKICNAKVAVFGVGGVGGYVCEMLARAGIGTLLICDFDRVSESNINRQIIALKSTVGEFKVDVMQKRLNEISASLNLIKKYDRLTNENINDFDLSTFDYVVDAIDDIPNKLCLIKYCTDKNIKIISSMGAGNKICVPNYVVEDIYKTKYDKLAKSVRSKCKELGVKKLDVAYMPTDKIIANNTKTVGSISYHPSACGIVISSYVINKIIE